MPLDAVQKLYYILFFSPVFDRYAKTTSSIALCQLLVKILLECREWHLRIYLILFDSSFKMILGLYLEFVL